MKLDTTKNLDKQSSLRVKELLETYYEDNMDYRIAALAATHSSMGMWDVDTATQTVRWSNSLIALTGLKSGAKVEFGTLYDIMHPDDFEDASDTISNHLELNQQFDCEFRIIRPIDGKVVWIQAAGKSLFCPEGNVIRMVGSIIDISHIKNAEERAKLADQSKSEFLANMSHEIRTPMNGIMGMAELLQYAELGPRETEFVNVINRSGNALLSIINDILDFSKIEAGHMELEAEPFNLRDALEDITKLISSKAIESEIDLLLRIQPDLPSNFIGDVGRIRQVLTNIIGNAVKFTSDGHVFINVIGMPKKDRVELSIIVEDTGIGIEPDKQKTIFEKFNQADTSTTREYGGTGLGLAIVTRLLGLMDGSISLESEIGKGSKFTVHLELPTSEDVAVTDRPEPHSGSANVLIIDDNEVNRDILKEQLQHWGYKAVAAPSAKIGLSVLERALEKSIQIDLIILDYQMPVQSGADFMRLLNAHEVHKDLPVIMLSSIDKPSLRRRMDDLDISAFLCKPAKAVLLRQTMTEVLSNSSLPRRDSSKILVQNKADERSKLLPVTSNETETVDVLIAEDNEVNQKYAQYAFEELNVDNKIVENGLKAVEMWERLTPKVVLMDISMPKMNGYEATAAIRDIEKRKGLPRTPIIAVTAHSLKEDEEKCYANDMDGYISKPMSLKNLQACLEEWGILETQSLKLQA